MNRNEEYFSLMKELESTPMALDYAMQRTEARIKSGKHKRRFLAVPVSSIAVFLVVFTVLINCSPVFAYTCGRIPFIKELAKVVAFSPSLLAAVENQYVQPIEEKQRLNGITASIEYVIVDQKQLSIFYSLNSDTYTAMDAMPEIKAIDGSLLEGYTLHSTNYRRSNGELNHITIDFVDRDMPKSMLLTLKVEDRERLMHERSVEESLLDDEVYEESEYISVFTFNLAFDPYFTAQGEKIVLNEKFTLDGQTLTLETAEIYPTHMRVKFLDEKENTAWLKGLSFYVENEEGKRFEKIGNGITATGSVDSPMMASHRLESAFFSNSKELTLYITGVEWLDKDKQKIRLDLANVTGENLPQGVSFESAEQTGKSWMLTFGAKVYKEGASYQIWSQDYYDEEGNKYNYNNWSSDSAGYWDEKEQQYINTPNRFYERIPLIDYPYDSVYMSPLFSRKVELNEPIKIKIKK